MVVLGSHGSFACVVAKVGKVCKKLKLKCGCLWPLTYIDTKQFPVRQWEFKRISQFEKGIESKDKRRIGYKKNTAIGRLIQLKDRDKKEQAGTPSKWGFQYHRNHKDLEKLQDISYRSWGQGTRKLAEHGLRRVQEEIEQIIPKKRRQRKSYRTRSM